MYFQSINNLVSPQVSKRVERVIDDMISLLAAETISARITSRDLITRAELQVRLGVRYLGEEITVGVRLAVRGLR